jgi:hypothetical protein
LRPSTDTAMAQPGKMAIQGAFRNWEKDARVVRLGQGLSALWGVNLLGTEVY